MENQQPQKPARNTMRGVLSHLKQMGLQPHTVIDVGAAAGTYELYETFPDAEHILIEPLQEFEEDLRNICATYNASYILAAADATVGTTTIYVHPEQLTGSSQLQQAEGKYADGFPRLVPSTTVDSVCKEKGVQGPFLLKADVQGNELQVLAGAQKILEQTDALLLEARLYESYQGAPEFYALLHTLKTYEFVVYDFCEFLCRPLDNALHSVDMLFVKEYGPFRTSKCYTSQEQRKKKLEEFYEKTLL